MARLVPLLLLAALAVGCGSESSTLSHAELVEQADAICAKAHAATAKVERPQQDSLVVAYLDRLIAIGQDEHVELSALEPPAEDATTYAELLGRFRTTIRLTERARAAAKAGKVPRYKVLVAEVVRQNTDTRAFAGGFGLQVCSQSG